MTVGRLSQPRQHSNRLLNGRPDSFKLGRRGPLPILQRRSGKHFDATAHGGCRGALDLRAVAIPIGLLDRDNGNIARSRILSTTSSSQVRFLFADAAELARHLHFVTAPGPKWSVETISAVRPSRESFTFGSRSVRRLAIQPPLGTLAEPHPICRENLGATPQAAPGFSFCIASLRQPRPHASDRNQ
jgi:hypothetical protein